MSKKTLVLILNHNTANLSSNLFNSLYPFEDDIYETFVLDNGSDEDELNVLSSLLINKQRIIKTNSNLLFGGGLNYAFEIIQNNSEKFDSLLFLNSDLIIHPYNFVKALKHYLEIEELDIISPCVLQPSVNQNFWKQMHCWNSPNIRKVKWVDLQAPMFSREFITHKAIVPEKLKYGWGLDLLYGMLTDKIGIADFIPVIHLDSQTVKRCCHEPIISDYWVNAEINMREFFKVYNYNKFLELREYGKQYGQK